MSAHRQVPGRGGALSPTSASHSGGATRHDNTALFKTSRRAAAWTEHGSQSREAWRRFRAARASSALARRRATAADHRRRLLSLCVVGSRRVLRGTALEVDGREE